VTGTSAAGIIVIMAVILVGAMAMILWIFVAGRGSFRHRRTDHRPGDVHGGIHVGDPGSVMRRRDAPANPADPAGTGQDKQLGRAAQARPGPAKGGPVSPVARACVAVPSAGSSAPRAMRREPHPRETGNQRWRTP
jgi:hypothetical protein